MVRIKVLGLALLASIAMVTQSNANQVQIPKIRLADRSRSALAPKVLRAAVVSVAKAMVTEKFRDLAGAQLRNVVVWNIGNSNTHFTVCGEISGKDRIAAIEGFKRFSALVRNDYSLEGFSPYLEGRGAGDNFGIAETCKESQFQPGWKM